MMSAAMNDNEMQEDEKKELNQKRARKDEDGSIDSICSHDASSRNLDDSRDDEQDRILENKLQERNANMFPNSLRNMVGDKLTHSSKETQLLSIFDIFEKVWPSNRSIEEVNCAVEKIPYLAEALKIPLSRATTAVLKVGDDAVIEEVNDDVEIEEYLESDQQTKRLIDLLRKAEEGRRKAEEGRRKAEEGRRKAERLSVIRHDCVRIVVHIAKATEKVKMQLLSLAGLNQAEVSVTTQNVASQPSHPKVARKNELSAAKETSRGLAIAEPSTIFSDILEQYMPIERVLDGISEPMETEVNDESKSEARLKFLATYLDAHLSNSKFLAKDSPDYKKNVLDVIKKLKEDIRSGKSFQKNTTASDTNYTPGAYAHEDDGTQLWIQFLLQMIGECLEPSYSSTGTPTKSSVRREIPIPKTQMRRKRKIDFLLQKEGRWYTIIFDDNLMVPYEVKPGCRHTEGAIVLLDGARDQCLSHLAKHLFVAFNLAGYGVPCHATALIGNMGALQILQLRYENVGTPDAKLVLYQSALFPLMPEACFTRWAASANATGTKKDQFNTLHEQMYGKDGKGGMDRNGVPKGYRALFNVMKQPSKKLHGISIDTTSDILGEVLGTGGTGLILRRIDHDGQNKHGVVKLSRYGVKSDIENEWKILKKLTTIDKIDPSMHIPTLLSKAANHTIAINLGSVPTLLPAIETSPEGANAAFSFQDAKKGAEGDLKLVLDGITSALNYMHAQSIFHCDVSPKNIIITDKPPGSERRAVLIDFSLSRQVEKTTKVFGFFGTPNYVHREIFFRFLQNQKGWYLREEHDKAGLGFVLAFFASGCRHSRAIDGYPKTVKNETTEDEKCLELAMDTRLEDARKAVKESDYSKNLKTRIAELLDCDDGKEGEVDRK